MPAEHSHKVDLAKVAQQVVPHHSLVVTLILVQQVMLHLLAALQIPALVEMLFFKLVDPTLVLLELLSLLTIKVLKFRELMLSVL
mgnify:CR=1 FL=1